MRGSFRERPPALSPPTSEGEGGFDIPRSELRITQYAHEWCERRLLARIHRLTLDGLRRRIQPVAPEVYLEYLAKRHGLLRDRGPVSEQRVREVVAQLQGFELPAGAWEEYILAPRIADYDPQALDQLFLSGELVWGRLCPPKRDTEDGPALAAITRTIPVSLVYRQDLGWLLPEDRPPGEPFAGANAKEVLNCLERRGALFFAELKSLSGLLGGHVEDALRQLAALGLVTSDTFAAIRSLTRGAKPVGRRRPPTKLHGHSAPVGRWSRFPGIYDKLERDEIANRWANLLLNRYGVVFRDLLMRESAAPTWFEIVRVLRRMELRGEVRGGRFISGVAGEQFALESAVNDLRELRDKPGQADDWIVVNGADPVNLSGIVTAGPRIAATHKNAAIYHRGRCLAAKVAGRIDFFGEVEPEVQLRMRKALQVGRKPRVVPAEADAAVRAS
jgi:ATP-dependent Lhr-like helicase